MSADRNVSLIPCQARHSQSLKEKVRYILFDVSWYGTIQVNLCQHSHFPFALQNTAEVKDCRSVSNFFPVATFLLSKVKLENWHWHSSVSHLHVMYPWISVLPICACPASLVGKDLLSIFMRKQHGGSCTKKVRWSLFIDTRSQWKS